jgi:hypothetical protein
MHFKFKLIRKIKERISEKSTPSLAQNRVFYAFMIFEVKNLELEVDLVLCGIFMQFFELNRSFVLDRLPVNFATKIEQAVFDFLISVLTTAEAN